MVYGEGGMTMTALACEAEFSVSHVNRMIAGSENGAREWAWAIQLTPMSPSRAVVVPVLLRRDKTCRTAGRPKSWLSLTTCAA
jgi:hypothetical protein